MLSKQSAVGSSEPVTPRLLTINQASRHLLRLRDLGNPSSHLGKGTPRCIYRSSVSHRPGRPRFVH